MAGDFLAGNCSQEHTCIQNLQDLLLDAHLTYDLLGYKCRIDAIATLYLGCLESKGILEVQYGVSTTYPTSGHG